MFFYAGINDGGFIKVTLIAVVVKALG